MPLAGRIERARTLLACYAALAFLAGRGFQQTGEVVPEHLWPAAWGPLFYIAAALILVHAIAIQNRVTCAVSGLTFLGVVTARIFGSWYNQRAAVPYVPGRTSTTIALLGAVLLSSALVWRYLLWPLTSPGRRR